MQFLKETQAFIDEFVENGGSEQEAQEVLSHLLELSVIMYRKGEIKHVQQPNKAELVCQLKKGSRRLALNG